MVATSWCSACSESALPPAGGSRSGREGSAPPEGLQGFTRNLSRIAEQAQSPPVERRASWLELFFDLVFVAAVAALSANLHEDHSLEGLAVFAGLFVPVWWAWWGFTWFSAGFDEDDLLHRISILGLMVVVAALASGVAGAAHGEAGTFVVAYSGYFFVLAALYARAWAHIPESRPVTSRYAIGYSAGAAIWLASLLLDPSARPFAWVLGMGVLMAFPVIAAGSSPVLTYDRAHISERYGLFTLIVLGEAVVVAVAGLETDSSLTAAITAILGFSIAATIWWVYFGRWRPMPATGLGSGWVWAQGHLLVFAGITAAAVGIEFLIEAAATGESPEIADRLPLGAGLASYLVAMASIRWATRRFDWVVAMRFGTALTLVALSLIVSGDPSLLVALSAALLIGEAVIEMTKAPAPEQQRRGPLPHQIAELRFRSEKD